MGCYARQMWPISSNSLNNRNHRTSCRLLDRNCNYYSTFCTWPSFDIMIIILWSRSRNWFDRVTWPVFSFNYYSYALRDLGLDIWIIHFVWPRCERFNYAEAWVPCILMRKYLCSYLFSDHGSTYSITVLQGENREERILLIFPDTIIENLEDHQTIFHPLCCLSC